MLWAISSGISPLLLKAGLYSDSLLCWSICSSTHLPRPTKIIIWSTEIAVTSFYLMKYSHGSFLVNKASSIKKESFGSPCFIRSSRTLFLSHLNRVYWKEKLRLILQSRNYHLLFHALELCKKLYLSILKPRKLLKEFTNQQINDLFTLECSQRPLIPSKVWPSTARIALAANPLFTTTLKQVLPLVSCFGWIARRFDSQSIREVISSLVFGPHM